MKCRSSILLAAFFLAAFMPARAAYAACASPAGVAGDMMYNATYNVMQYCDTNNWISMYGVRKLDGLTDAYTEYTTDHNMIIGGNPHDPTVGLASGASGNLFIGEDTGPLAAGTTSATDYNTGVGYNVLNALTIGSRNAAFGIQSLKANTSGSYNTATGMNALYYNTTGSYNVAIGTYALEYNIGRQESTAVGYKALWYADNTTANTTSYNTAVGAYALQGSTTAANNTGVENTAVGWSSLAANTSGNSNTAVGKNAMPFNNTGAQNTATGAGALKDNTIGTGNTALGYVSLYNNVARSESTAVGFWAMRYADNTTVATTSYNTAVGAYALMGSTTAANNTAQYVTAVGHAALKNNTSGDSSAAVGEAALTNNTTGAQNVAVGSSALRTNVGKNQGTAVGWGAMWYADSTTANVASYNTAVGYSALMGSTTAANNTGDANTAVGWSALAANTTGTNNTAIGKNAMPANTGGGLNTAIGAGALKANTIGIGNTALGFQSLYNLNDPSTSNNASYNTALGYQALMAGTTANYSTAVGTYALKSITSSSNNTAIGYEALSSNSTGFSSTAVGYQALKADTFGNNTAVGYNALRDTTAGGNTAMGALALAENTTATDNTGFGERALTKNTTGLHNTAVGSYALAANVKNQHNTAVGYQALKANNDATATNASDNTAVGYQALLSNTSARFNTAVGAYALKANLAGELNVAVGNSALQASTGSNNTALGVNALQANTSASGNTAIGYAALYNVTDDAPNTAVGYQALYNTKDTGGALARWNTGVGYNALYFNTTGFSNTALGSDTLYNNTTGANNIAIGPTASGDNTTGTQNVAIGTWALRTNVGRDDSTAVGYWAMRYANSASGSGITYNTAVGAYALQGGATAAANTGTQNTAIGHSALKNATSGTQNTAMGINALLNNTTGKQNTGIGMQALQDNSTSDYNTGIGAGALQFNTGAQNTALGAASLYANTSGANNTAVGYLALRNNVTKQESTAIGHEAMRYADDAAGGAITYNTAVGAYALRGSITPASNTGQFNTAIGSETLKVNTSGDSNVAVGTGALTTNADGDWNTAIGHNALWKNTSGISNIALGYFSLKANTTGGGNVSVGANALIVNTTGSSNVVVGNEALYSNILGGSNTALGHQALYSTNDATTAANASANTAIGFHSLYANTAGKNNTALGYDAGAAGTANTTGSNNTYIGFQAQSDNAAYNNSTALGAGAVITASDMIQIGTVGGPQVVRLPNGTTGQTPACSAALIGSLRYDTTTNAFTGCQGAGPAWAALGSGGGGGGAIDDLSDAVANSTNYNMLLGQATAGAGTSNNTSLGIDALKVAANPANSNTAIGSLALTAMTLGTDNTALGAYTLLANTTGTGNTALGTSALEVLTFGINNTAIGYGAGGGTLTTGSSNILIGNGVTTPASNTSNYLNIGGVITGDMTTSGGTLGGLAVNGTAAFRFPGGTTGQRPAGLGGMLRYNTEATPNDMLEYYDAETSSWVQFGPPGSGGIGPTAFAFTDLTDQQLAATISSNAVVLSGFSGTISALCNTNCIGIARNGVWGGTSANFMPGDTIAIRLTSSATPNTPVTTSVTVGTTTSAIWSVTTLNNVPNAFSFTDQTNVGLNQTITSNTVALGGTFPSATATCGGGCIGISRNGGAFVPGPVSGFVPTDTIAIRLTSSSSFSGVATASVTVGGTISGTWSVTSAASDPCAGAPALGAFCADGTVYAGLSPDGNVKMFTTPCDVGMTWSGSACTGSRTPLNWNNGNANPPNTGYTNAVTGRYNTRSLAVLTTSHSPYRAAKHCDDLVQSGKSDWYLPGRSELNVLYGAKASIGNFLTAGEYYWSSTDYGASFRAYWVRFSDGLNTNNTPNQDWPEYLRCVRGVVLNPTAFSFTNQVNVATSTLTTSNTVALGEFDGPVTATCGGSCSGISRNGAAFVAGPVSGFVAGDTIAIQMTSSASDGVAVTGSVTVGGTTSGTWSLTTAVDCVNGAPTPGTICPDDSVYAGLSPNGNVKMFVTRCDVGMSWNGTACTGSRVAKSWNNGTGGTGYTETGVYSWTKGSNNTATLAALADTGNPYVAAKWCADLVENGRSDWYFPAWDELSVMQTNRVAIGNFDLTGNWYSSSTQGDSTNAYIKRFSDAGVLNYPKSDTRFIRCARTNSFSFSDQTEVALNSTITSNTMTLTAVGTNKTATCGSGCTAISINGGAFVAGPVAGVNDGDTIAIRQTSSAAAKTTTTAIVTVGTVPSATWSVKTSADCDGSPSVGDVCADGTIYAGLSPDGNVKMFTTRCDPGMSWGTTSCNGPRASYTWNNGTGGTAYTETGVSSWIRGKANTATLAALVDGGTPYNAAKYCNDLVQNGRNDWYFPAWDELGVMQLNRVAIGNFDLSGNWYSSSTQGDATNAYIKRFSDNGTLNYPKSDSRFIRCVRTNSFSFTDQTEVALSSTITSNATTLTAVGTNKTATCNAGCTAISINGGAFVAGPVAGVNDGDTIAIQQTSSASGKTTTTATVTVGTVTSGTWSVKTATDCIGGTPLAGDICADGTVYAGLTPDGNIRMFTTRCDVGQSWAGTACNGARSTQYWNNGTSNWSNTGVLNYTRGKSNTATLAALVDAGTPYNAAKYCEDLVSNGWSDWYLPANAELDIVYTNNGAIGSFDTGGNWYWSSVEYDNVNAYIKRFSDGAWNGGGTAKNTGRYIRCIRTNSFSFADQTEVSLNTTITSNTVTLPASVGSNKTATCGSGCTAISINGAAFVAGPVGGVNSGDTIAIRQTSSATAKTTTTASVTVGTVPSGTWSVKTQADCAGSPSPGDVCADGTVYAGLSPDGNVKMYVTRCDVGMTWAGTACNGYRYTNQWNNGGGTYTVTGVTDINTGNANTATLAALADGGSPYKAAKYCADLVQNGNSDWYLPSNNEMDVIYTNRTPIGSFDTGGNWYWSSRELSSTNAYIKRFSDGAWNGGGVIKSNGYYARCARTGTSSQPASFSFTNQTGVATSATITSNTVSLGAFTGNLTATCGVGCTAISINGGAFVAGPVAGVVSGNTIAIRLTSAATFDTDATAIVTVGLVSSANWTVRTGSSNTKLGLDALKDVTVNTNNTAIGFEALKSNNDATTAANASNNTALGYRAGQAGTPITTGTLNTFLGASAQAADAALQNATAIGANAVVAASNTIVFGDTNVVNHTFSGTGAIRLPNGTTGQQPTCTGGTNAGALRYNTGSGFEACNGTAWGELGGASDINGLSDALTEYTTDHNFILGGNPVNPTVALTSGAAYNLFIGEGAGSTAANSTSATDNNLAVGHSALTALTTGGSNIAVGRDALKAITKNSNNVAVGYQALLVANDAATAGNASGNVGLGYQSLVANSTGQGNVALGYQAGSTTTTGNLNILIGTAANASSATVSNYLNIGGVITGDMATGNLAVNGTGALRLPNGTTGQQPGTPTVGMLRYNTTSNSFEGYAGSSPAWGALGGGGITSVSGAAAPVAGTMGSITVKTYCASGCTGTTGATWTRPSTLLYATVEVVGGGGGGGGAVTKAGGAGGGGGGYARKTLSYSAIGASQTVTVGAGGTAGNTSGSAGGVGGTSSFGALITATGGSGGTGGAVAGTIYTGVTGGIGTLGDINIRGGSSATGNPDPVSTTSAPGGIGGAAAMGFGPAGLLPTGPVTGANGTLYGGGANGAGGNGGMAGGVGGGGIVIVTEYLP